jgi:hypothetical protein
VNSVASIAELPPPGPHRPGVPGAFGTAECDTPAAVTTCTDPDGQTDPAPILFYQVYSACGPSGADEGPP